MKKNLRWLIAGILALALTSCGVFFAPLEGRWNPLDPNFGDGYTEKNLYPTVDGHVMPPSMSSFFLPYMEVMNSQRALMKFNTGDIPKDIPHAELRLCLNSINQPFYYCQVRMVFQDWDAATTEWSFLASPLSPIVSPPVYLSTNGFYSWDVTALLRSVNPSSMKGLLVEPVSGAATSAQFLTTENGINKPHLVIWTK